MEQIERNPGETRYQFQGRVARIRHERHAAVRAAGLAAEGAAIAADEAQRKAKEAARSRARRQAKKAAIAA